jgi:hypothetical protein
MKPVLVPSDLLVGDSVVMVAAGDTVVAESGGSEVSLRRNRYGLRLTKKSF